MSRSSDARRPYVRSTRSIVRRAAEEIAAAAGSAAPIERARIEPLEPRKLLFSVTIDPGSVDASTGLGTATANFAYFIPYLHTNADIPTPLEPNELITEDFNDEDVGDAFSGRIFDGSDIIYQESNNTIRSTVTGPVGGLANPEDFQLLDVESLFADGSFFSFATLADGNSIAGGLNVSEIVTFTVGTERNGESFSSGDGFFDGQVDVQLVFRNQVVDTYTNAELFALAGSPTGTVESQITLVDRNQVVAGVFDEIRFVKNVGAGPATNSDFFIDDLIFSQPVNNFEEVIEPRIYGVNVVFSGPAGATASFFDLYDRAIVDTIALGQDGNTNFIFGDADDNGIPEFNDGIGRIELSGFNEDSNFSIIGTEIVNFGTGTPPPFTLRTENGFASVFTDSLSLLEDFDEAGFGFAFVTDPGGEVNVYGVPTNGVGTVIIGSPFVRPQNNYNPGGLAMDTLDFQRDNQGIFLNASDLDSDGDLDPVSINDISTNAILFGSSNFSGSVGSLSSALFLGSASIAGDLGTFYSGSDAGAWFDDPEALPMAPMGQVNAVGSEISVGRTVGEYAVAGRNYVSLTIDGDLSSGTSAPAADVLVYDEREVVFGFNPGTANPFDGPTGIYALSRSGLLLPGVVTSSSIGTIGASSVLPSLYGDTLLRNDSVLNAEFIGGASSSVVVRGSIGGSDPVTTAEDRGDVYAFAATGETEIILEQLNPAPAHIRILDVDGRTVASTSLTQGDGFGQVLRFTPDSPGVYYISVIDGNNGNVSVGAIPYAFIVSGMAPVSLGSYRTGLGNGGNSLSGVSVPTVNLLSGNVGSVRIGVGYVDSSGTQASNAGTVLNFTGDDANTMLGVRGFALSTPGSLYSFNAGGDINNSIPAGSQIVTLSVGGDLGTFHTGRAGIGGVGDAGSVILDIGGRIGLIDINGNIGADSLLSTAPQTLDNRFAGESFVIRTGLDSDRGGDIGLIIVGGHVLGDVLTVDTSATPGSVVGGLLVSQRIGAFGNDGSGDDLGFFDGTDGVNLNLGDGSDIRFVDIPNIDLLEGQASSLPIITGQTLEIVDDAGGRVQISVSRATAVPLTVGQVIVVPVEGAEGVAIARIVLNDLTGTGTPGGGTTLNINAVGGQSESDVISIGRIVVLNSDVGSQIVINGSAQIDVWRIDAPQGLAVIENRTPGGDIVAIDTLTLNSVRVTDGDLGRTEVPEFGPRLIGPRLGLQLGVNTTVEASFGIDPLGTDLAGNQRGILDGDFNGNIFRPTNDGLTIGGNAYADDIGYAMDDLLNGVIVRTGDLTLAESGGAIGDVITQGGDILTVRADFDNSTDEGDFDGIIGSIFSQGSIDLVQVGDGLISSETGTSTPFAEGGIFAQGVIRRVEATQAGSFINGLIFAAVSNPSATSTVFPNSAGIDSIFVSANAMGIFDSQFGTTELDDFFVGPSYGNDNAIRGAIRDISVSMGDIFRSQVTTGTLSTIRVTGGALDATQITAVAAVTGQISADNIRNSTLGGGALEFAPSIITVGEDLQQLTALQGGTISDTQISVLGEVRSSISAGSIVRSAIEVANTLRSLTLTSDLLSSEVVTGQLVNLTVGNSIRVSSITVSGPLVNARVQNEISRSQISVTGPDGRIDVLSAMNDLDADITSSGRIGTIRSTNGSIDGSIVTTNSTADIVLIDAGVDFLSTTDIGGNLAEIEAGRNIGNADNPGVILVRGNLTELDVSDGRLFSDLRVGGGVTMGITIGSVVNLPTNVKGDDGDITVFGRISEIEITGDYDGVITSESSGIGSVTITDGSLLAAGAILANDGGIGTISIIRGHLFGTIFSELSINRIIVDGQGTAFGDIGINPNLSSGVGTNTNDPNRNQLPPTVVGTLGIDGPIIASGRSINSITVTSGDIYEAFIYARNFIGSLNVQAGNITTNDSVNTRDANVIAAGDLIQTVTVSGNVRSTLFLAGVTSFGDESIFNLGDRQYDDRAGNPVGMSTATGNDTNGEAGDGVDTLKSGVIKTVSIGGDASNVAFTAGITAGDDGVYNTFDAGERNVLGLSIVDQVTITGTQTNVTFSADRGAVFVNGTNVRGSNFGATTANATGELASLVDAFAGGSVNLGALGTEVPRNGSQVFTWNGTSFRVEWTDPSTPTGAEAAGQGVIWDGAGTLILANTSIDQSVVVTVLDNDSNNATALPALLNFNIRSNDEASIGTLRIRGENGRSSLTGDSNIVIDNYVRTLEIDDYEGTGAIRVGEDIGTLTADRFAGGSVTAGFVGTTNINASLVVFSGNVPSFSYTGAGTVNVAQNATATFNVERSINAFNVGGVAARLLFRAGGSLNSFTADSVERSRLSVSNVIGSIEVEGDVFDTSFIAGGDLGSDAANGNGSSSADIDRVTSGTINEVEIGGNFIESDLVAGFLRGPDGFFATSDDDGAAGNSSIGTVEIGGTQVGSNVNSESYGLLSAGTIGTATIGSNAATSSGNFRVGPVVGQPVPIQITNFEVIQDSRLYTVFFTFNQDIDFTAFTQALRIREIRDETSAAQPFDASDPLSLTPPTPGVPGSGDYSIIYDAENFVFAVTIDRTITDRDLLPEVVADDTVEAGTRQDLPSAGIYRFEVISDVIRGRNAQARLDGDGNGFATLGDNFSFDDIVGDAGDVAATRSLERVSRTGTNNNTAVIDFYDAIDLNLVLDSNSTPDGLPEVNSSFTLRGALADHPDRDLDLFGFGADKDVYSLTLQAGQILRLGEVSGAASQALRSLYFSPADNSLPLLQYSARGPADSGTPETAQSIVLPSSQASIVNGDLSTDAAILIKESGTYLLVVEAGTLPSASPFVPGFVPAGATRPNQTGNYAFAIEIFDDGDSGFNAGNDAGNGANVVNAPTLSLFSTTDQSQRVVIDGFSFQRLAGTDGVFGNGDDVVQGMSQDGSIVSSRTGNRLVSTIDSSIGTAGATGRPGVIQSDVDVFHLNNFQPIQAGSFMTITVKLAESGSDLGSVDPTAIDDLNVGAFAGLNSFVDLSQVVQFALFETTNSTDQQSADLIFSPTDFTPRAGTPDTLIAANGSNQYGFDANGDFFISFAVPPSLTGGNGSFAVYLQGAFQADYQIEVVTQGTAQQQKSSQNVLIETNGGTIDWLSVEGGPVSFGAFDADSLGFSGFVSNISVEEFILSNVVTTLNQIYAAAGLDVTFSTNPADFEFEEFSTVFVTNDNNPFGLLTASDYGVSERSDPFNTDKEDEAIVFAPAYSTLGYNPSPSDLNNFIESLSNGIGRRVGELVGLRLTEANAIGDAGGDIDIFGQESIAFPFISDDLGLDIDSNYIIPGTSRELVNHRQGLFGIDDTGFFIGDQNASGLLSQILD